MYQTSLFEAQAHKFIRVHGRWSEFQTYRCWHGNCPITVKAAPHGYLVTVDFTYVGTYPTFEEARTQAGIVLGSIIEDRLTVDASE